MRRYRKPKRELLREATNFLLRSRKCRPKSNTSKKKGIAEGERRRQQKQEARTYTQDAAPVRGNVKPLGFCQKNQTRQRLLLAIPSEQCMLGKGRRSARAEKGNSIS